MLIIPSRGRPHNLRRLIDACQITGCVSPAIIRIDDDDSCLPEYRALTLPSGWVLVVGSRAPLSTIYNEVYQANHQQQCWLFLADDVVPVTPHWDRKLIEIAGSDGMAVPAGGESTGGCPHFVLGGELVRSIGWLALPGLDRLWIDTVWHDIAEQRGVLRHVPWVTLEHLHFSSGKALFDRTYKKEKKAQDRAIYEAWKSATRPLGMPDTA
jgi:hypothetical protein